MKKIKWLCIVPARSGSKRLPGKNLKVLNGMSLLERTLRQAKEIDFDWHYLTTDSPEMVDLGVKLYFPSAFRPEHLCTDKATSEDVIRHAINVNPGYDKFCLLQVTSPLRSTQDIWNCLALSNDGPVVSTHNGKRNGAIYIDSTLPTGGFFQNPINYEMPYERSIDIDTQEDFDEAERILNGLRPASTGGILS